MHSLEVSVEQLPPLPPDPARHEKARYRGWRCQAQLDRDDEGQGHFRRRSHERCRVSFEVRSVLGNNLWGRQSNMMQTGRTASTMSRELEALSVKMKSRSTFLRAASAPFAERTLSLPPVASPRRSLALKSMRRELLPALAPCKLSNALHFCLHCLHYDRALEEVPKKMVVIGGGIIGLEMVNTTSVLSAYTY